MVLPSGLFHLGQGRLVRPDADDAHWPGALSVFLSGGCSLRSRHSPLSINRSSPDHELHTPFRPPASASFWGHSGNRAVCFETLNPKYRRPWRRACSRDMMMHLLQRRWRAMLSPRQPSRCGARRRRCSGCRQSLARCRWSRFRPPAALLGHTPTSRLTRQVTTSSLWCFTRCLSAAHLRERPSPETPPLHRHPGFPPARSVATVKTEQLKPCLRCGTSFGVLTAPPVACSTHHSNLPVTATAATLGGDRQHWRAAAGFVAVAEVCGAAADPQFL